MMTIKAGQVVESIALNDRAFLYGDGCFSTIRVVAGQACLWSHHLHRLQDCQRRLGLQVELAEIEQQVQQAAQQIGQGALKIIISRGQGQRGYLPPDQPAQVYMQLFPNPQMNDLSVLPYATPIDSGVLDLQLGLTMPQLVGLKTLNRLEQVLLRQALAQTSWPEALVADLTGHLVEGVQSNCFFYAKGGWQTPSLARAGIAGVMRAEILQRMKQQGINCQQVDFQVAHVGQIESLLFL
jgi:4-amino-4-deoxychorismate lyase